MKTKKLKNRLHATFKMWGGFELDKQINSGSHGIIYSIKDDPTKVAKVFLNKKIVKPSLCKKIMDTLNTSCNELDYEFKIQQLIYDFIGDVIFNPYIKIPMTYEFTQNSQSCMYLMDKIYYDKVVTLNMIQKKNYTYVSSQLNITPSDLALLIGELFSILHFKLNLDGYDCEMILGQHKSGSSLYFIDFDKVSCFDFEVPQTLYRKYDEGQPELKELVTEKKLANFLIESFTNMSLLPLNYVLKQYFIQGYRKHFKPTSMTMQNVMDHIINSIDNYMVDDPDVN